MKFLYADELKRIFQVTGYFYTLNVSGVNFPCRSILEIKRIRGISTISKLPDAVVVMMNPGSSVPLLDNFEPQVFSSEDVSEIGSGKIMVPTRPDNAQYQIMRLMQFKKWDFVRVLNLSDLRNGNSSNFKDDFKRFETLSSDSIHSIVHPTRRSELGLAVKCNGDTKIIAGWGSVDVLQSLAIEFLSLFDTISGLETTYPWYRYPSPYRKDQKLEWLKEIRKIV